MDRSKDVLQEKTQSKNFAARSQNKIMSAIFSQNAGGRRMICKPVTAINSRIEAASNDRKANNTLRNGDRAFIIPL
jgi:hypothetical protein